ncbi:hypothetical protein LCGC14_2742200, partial [marine sediment metagenome]
ILVDAGHFNPNQEKSTTFQWYDALTDNLIVYYKMDEGSGNIVDATGNQDCTTPDDPVYSKTGIIGTAIYFSGDDFFDCDGITSTTQEYTFQWWINSSNVYGAGGGYIFDFSIGRMYLAMSSPVSTNDLGIHDNVNQIVFNVNPATDGTFHHIIMTIQSGNASVYVDGEIYDSTGTANGINLGGGVGLGSAWAGTSSFVIVSTLDEIAFWERILTFSEIQSLYGGGSGFGYPFVPPDLTNPNVTILSPANTTYSTPINFTVNAVDEIAMGECWVTVNASVNNHTMLNTSDNPSYYNFTAPSIYANEGYKAQFYCNDSSGNVNGTEDVSFSVGIISVEIVFPTNNSNSSSVNLNINYTASSQVGFSRCWYSNDTYLVNTTLTDCGTNITEVVWTEAQHNATIWANDTGGSLASSRVTFIIDLTYPI